MTSQVNPNNIDGTYPVAGQDNDSQGFRDNFTNIRNNFTYIKAEVEDLQNKAVLKSALTNTTLDNSLLGNAIVGASLTQWRENFNDIGSVSGSITVDFTNGNFQKITMNGATTLAFSFPSNTSGQYASVKLWVHVETAAYTLTLPSSVTLGDPDTIAGLSGSSPPIITFSSAELANATDFFFEFYTFNSGTTIGIQDLTRNRDVDLSGLNVSGNLTLDNLTSSGNVVTTNGIFWAGNGQPFTVASGGSGAFSTITASSTIIGSGNIVAAATTTSTSTTTGSFVAKGGAGIVGNVYAGGNVVVTNNMNVSGNVGIDGNIVSLYDSILDLHTYGNLAAWAADDGKDIGIRMHYYKGADRLSALYMENSNETLVWMQNATETNSNITGTFGNVQFGSLLLANTTASTSTTSGALQVLGGAGITGNTVIGGNLVTNGGRINSSTFLATVVTGQELVANVAYNTFIIDTASSATIANLWITIPSAAVNGTELVISTLAPLTSCNIRAIGGTVKWIPTTFASAGNVAVKLVYSSTSTAWLRSA